MARAKALSKSSAVSQRTAGTPNPLASETQSIRGSPRSSSLEAAGPASPDENAIGVVCEDDGGHIHPLARHGPETLQSISGSAVAVERDHLAIGRRHRRAHRHRHPRANGAPCEHQPLVRFGEAGLHKDRQARGHRVVGDHSALRRPPGDAVADGVGAELPRRLCGHMEDLRRRRGLGAERLGQRLQRARSILVQRR
jgi:hypothetical protein